MTDGHYRTFEIFVEYFVFPVDGETWKVHVEARFVWLLMAFGAL